jgi:cbb3-type cytochrome oxidase subunit 3
LVTPVNRSQITLSTFDVPTSTVAFMHITSAQFTLSDVSFRSQAGPVTFIELESAVSVRIETCSFNWPETESESRALKIADSPDVKLVHTSFNASGKVGNLTDSLVMVAFCCFRQESAASLIDMFDMDASSVVHEGPEVAFHQACPWQEFTATLSAEQKAYAIATVVIFFLCFAVLFIGLIVFVFCKARKEEVEYAEIQQDPNIMDEGDMDIPST